MTIASSFFAFALSIGILAANPTKQAFKQWNKLSEGKLTSTALAVNNAMHPQVQQSVQENLTLWNTFIAENIKQPQLVETYSTASHAVVLIVARDAIVPHKISIVPFCFLKKQNHWKLAPMLTNFSFTVNDEKSRKQAEFADAWLEKKLPYYQEKLQEEAIQSFENQLLSKREEILQECTDAVDLMQYFLKQVEKSSVHGVLAATGFTNFSENMRTPETMENDIYRSVVLGLDKSRSERGGWSILTSSITMKSIVSHIKNAEELEEGDVVGLALLNPKANEIPLQLAEFAVVSDRGRHKISLPNALFMHVQEDGELYFDADTFDKWSINNNQLRETVFPQLPSLIFNALPDSLSQNPKSLNKTLYQTAMKQDFVRWLTFHKPAKKLNNATYKEYLNILLKRWIDQPLVAKQQIEHQAKSPDGSVLIVNSMLNLADAKKSYLEVQRFEKVHSNWHVIPSLNPQKKRLQALLKKKNAQHLATIDFQQHLRHFANEISIFQQNYTTPKIYSKEDFQQTVEIYLQQLAEGNMQEITKYVYRLAEKEPILQSLHDSSKLAKMVDSRRVISVVKKKNIALAAVEYQTYIGKSKFYQVYLLNAQPQGVKIDAQNTVLIKNAGHFDQAVTRMILDKNQRAFTRIDQYYAKKDAAFIRQKITELQEILHPH